MAGIGRAGEGRRQAEEATLEGIDVHDTFHVYVTWGYGQVVGPQGTVFSLAFQSEATSWTTESAKGAGEGLEWGRR